MIVSVKKKDFIFIEMEVTYAGVRITQEDVSLWWDTVSEEDKNRIVGKNKIEKMKLKIESKQVIIQSQSDPTNNNVSPSIQLHSLCRASQGSS
jgi:hypothetical protein